VRDASDGPTFRLFRLEGRPFLSLRRTSLCAVLIATRREAGLTQAQLAERLGKPASFIAKIEIGERRLDVVEFVAIAKAMKLDPRKIFDRFLGW
jgi:transcriptional regulator with XRE-family HTH domain